MTETGDSTSAQLAREKGLQLLFKSAPVTEAVRTIREALPRPAKEVNGSHTHEANGFEALTPGSATRIARPHARADEQANRP